MSWPLQIGRPFSGFDLAANVAEPLSDEFEGALGSAEVDYWTLIIFKISDSADFTTLETSVCLLKSGSSGT